MRLFVQGPAAVAACVLAAAQAHAQFSDIVRNIGGTNYTYIDYSYNNARSNAAHNHSFLARLYVPADYDPNKTYPIVMFLHGDGEAGNNNSSQINTAINNLTVNAENRDFLLYVPQSPGTYWGEENMTMALANFARAAEEYNADPNHIYVTGLSKGGTGVHRAMNDFNDLYAGYVPLSTANSSSLNPFKAVGQPVWYFVGRQDGFLGSTRGAVNSLVIQQGGTTPTWPSASDPDFQYEYGTLKYTEYQIGGHSNTVWNNGAYNTPAMYDWLLGLSKSVDAPAPGQTVGINFNGGENRRTVDGAGASWNTLGHYGTERTEAMAMGFGVDTTGASTTIAMSVAKAFDNASNSVPVGVTAFSDATVAGEYWRTYSGQTAQLLLHGLTPGAAYTIEIFASTTESNIIGLYTAGDASDTLTATNNLADFALLESVIADADGKILLTVAPTSGAARAVINAISITAEVPEPASAGLVVLACGILALRRRAS